MAFDILQYGDKELSKKERWDKFKKNAFRKLKNHRILNLNFFLYLLQFVDIHDNRKTSRVSVSTLIAPKINIFSNFRVAVLPLQETNGISILSQRRSILILVTS